MVYVLKMVFIRFGIDKSIQPALIDSSRTLLEIAQKLWRIKGEIPDHVPCIDLGVSSMFCGKKINRKEKENNKKDVKEYGRIGNRVSCKSQILTGFVNGPRRFLQNTSVVSAKLWHFKDVLLFTPLRRNWNLYS